MLGDDLFGRLVEVLCAVIVAERVVSPEADDLGAVGGRERLDGRPPIRELAPGLDDPVELGLLAHHL